ncbi:MAG: hypothetical protein E6H79_08090 [Betaproteobacteria bacterium]|nr:MAG: hypothetical protein E6H79_08090 [Betaproteobacteria bacterium]HEV8314579.1 PA2779 family protein [Burkholderiaceae bacterium]
MNRFMRTIAVVVATSVSYAGLLTSAQAALIPTEQVAAAQAPVGSGHERLNATLDRADVQTALQQRGISVDQARARVAALTDEEAAHVANQIDQAPAGASDVLGTIIFIFVLLLITDILGFTKIFPFTRSIR